MRCHFGSEIYRARGYTWRYKVQNFLLLLVVVACAISRAINPKGGDFMSVKYSMVRDLSLFSVISDVEP